MNVVLVLIDSLNLASLAAYRQTPVSTPALSEFARRAWRFDSHFVGSLPCMPARREIFTGFKELLWRPWGPLEPFHERLPRLLEQQGYVTGLVTDHYHYWEESANGYLQSFQSSELIRGHELDNWRPPLAEDEAVPGWVENIERWRPGAGRRYYANVKGFESEEDYFPAKVMTAAGEWLRTVGAGPRTRPFFLQVESFDVHEPFDVPEPYASLYSAGGAKDDFNVWPPYQSNELQEEFIRSSTPAELEFIRSQYDGKVAMVDRWFGELLRTLDELDLWDDTAVIVTTDHGHDLGQRGVFGKHFPHFDSHANIPLLVWHPQHRGEGRGVSALTSTVDLFSTILDLAGASEPNRLQSRSLLPLLSGERSSLRETHLYGTFGQGVCLTDGEWTIIKSPESSEPLYSYSSLQFHSLLLDEPALPTGQGRYIPGVERPQWKVPVKVRPRSSENYLFNRLDDPEQLVNLWDTQPQQRRRLLSLLVQALKDEGAPQEQFVRLGVLEHE